jgi:hypothetical protein
MRRLTPEERYYYNQRQQRKKLEEFAAHEIEWADDLLAWYQCRHEEITADEYRAVAFFKNREYLRKPGSLTLLYNVFQQCIRELPAATKENGFYLLCYRYELYARALEKGGYN